MKSRRKAREAALQALYQCDTLDDWSADAIELYFLVYHNPDVNEAVLEDEQQGYARLLTEGVIAHRAEIDSLLTAASVHWSVPRMSRVDRNLLRIAAYELKCMQDIPVKVAINEAIEVSKRYGTPESPHFVNGVLDKVASLLHPLPRPALNE